MPGGGERWQRQAKCGGGCGKAIEGAAGSASGVGLRYSVERFCLSEGPCTTSSPRKNPTRACVDLEAVILRLGFRILHRHDLSAPGGGNYYL